MTPVKILLTGATGLLGYNILNLLADKGYKIIAAYHRTPIEFSGDNVDWVSIDLENELEIVNNILNIKPDVIMHVAAYTDVDGCEINKEKAFKVNYLATKAISHISMKTHAYLVYVSTDYVFDGEKGMYKESDLPNPVNYYGLTKLLGETAILSMLPESSLVLRTSGLYGYSPTGKKNFGINALEKLVKGEEVHAFYDQYLSPTYAYFLAEGLIKVIEKKIVGVLHLAGERLSRYDFAVLLAKALGVDRALIKPISLRDAKLVAKRPRDSSLDTSRAKSEGLTIPSTVECLNHFVNTYMRKVGVKDAVQIL